MMSYIIRPWIEAGYSNEQIIIIGSIGFVLFLGTMLVAAKIIERIKDGR